MIQFISFLKTPLLVSSAAFFFLSPFVRLQQAEARGLRCESLFYGSLMYPEYFRALGPRVHHESVRRSLLEPARTWDDFKFRSALQYLVSHDLAWVETFVDGRSRFVLYRQGDGVFALGPETLHQSGLPGDLFETMGRTRLVYSKKLDHWFFK